MLPGPTIYRQCPHCAGHITQSTWSSWNTFNARFWTDGRVIGSTFADVTPLGKCPHCLRLVWLPEAEQIGQIDYKALRDLELLEFARGPYRFGHEIPDGRPWWKRLLGIGEPQPTWRLEAKPVKVKLSEEEEERFARDRKRRMELEAVAKEFEENSRPALKPEEADYLLFASEGERSVAQVRHARIRAWWCANDAIRHEDVRVSDEAAWSDVQKHNLERLYALLDDASDTDRLMKAEVARELGRFDEALSLLSGSFRAETSDAVETIRSLCQEHRWRVAEIPGPNW